LHGTNANPEDVLSPDGTTVNGGIFPGGRDDFYFTGDIVSITAETQPILTIVDGVEAPTVYNEKDVEPIKQQVHTSETKKLPDVYYIIPDAYSGSKSLQTILNYDNSEFTDFLKNKGFYIPTESFANYRMTQLSIPSTLTMKYLNYLSEIKGINSTYPKELVEITRHNEVIKNFKSLGYTTYAIEAGSMHTNKMENIDFRLCATKNVSEFGPMLIRTTILNPVQVHLFANEYREKILCGFSELTKMAENNESPKFVIAHLMIPHRPDVFGPNGEPILARLLILEDVDKYWNPELYLGQLKFTNLKLTEIISKLTDTNDPPIIIIQSDHGMRGLQIQDTYEYELMLRDFNIFKAYYFPGIGQNIEFEKTTSVNSFRVLFNLYFGYEYDLLEDKIYFSPWNKLYEFTDITEILIKNNTAI